MGLVFGISVLALASPASAQEVDSFVLSEENQQRVELVSNNSESNRDYLNEIIKSFEESPGKDTNESFNLMITEVLDNLEKADAETQDEYIQSLAEAENQVQETPSQTPKARITPQQAARAAYTAGTLLVRQKGHTMTANYMAHAANSNPGTYTNKNDAWAQKLDKELSVAYYSRLKSEAFLGGRASGSFGGSYSFNSGDPYTALHAVNYTVSYRRNSDGNYGIYVKISDVFDFAWGKYNSISVGFGNNYCYAMQQLGLIKPFKIEVIRTTRW